MTTEKKIMPAITPIIASTVVAFAALSLHAAKYYVSSTYEGDDSDGTQLKPFKTIQAALDAPNDWGGSIWIEAGTYSITSELKPPASRNGITIRSVSGNPADVTIDAQNCRCFNCTGTDQYNFYFRGITFANGAATGNGGGVLASSNCTFDDCVVTNCSATGNGGGIYAAGSIKHIYNVTVYGCSAATDGGGIYLGAELQEQTGISNVCIKACTGRWGGGFYLNGTGPAVSTIVDCDISGNTASGQYGGGGIFAKYATIRNCTVTNNVCDHSDTSSVGTGGSGIRISSYGTIDGCLVKGNSFTYDCSSYNGGGAAVYLANGSSLVNSAIIGNSGARSVGFQWASSGGVLISNCLFKSNVARRTDANGYGGVFSLYNLKSDSMITDCRFIDNEASQNGGLMEIQMGDSSSSTLRIRNCLMTGNVQTKGGGLILSSSGSGNTQLAIENCTIVSNRVDAGPVVTFWDEGARNHTTVRGCAILFNNGKTAFDDTFKVSANVAYNCTELRVISEGNITYDSTKPLFVDLGNGDYRPTADSQLRDIVPAEAWMGDGSQNSTSRDLGTGYELQTAGTYGVNVVWTDSVPRLYKDSADIGCFEFWLPPTPPGLVIIFK